MTVKPNLYDQARQELTTRFSTRSFDMERVFLDALRHAADEVGADWSVVEKADSSDDRSEDWRNLNQLIASKAIPKIEAALEKDNVNGQTVLTYHLNWLARYDQVVMLSRVA